MTPAAPHGDRRRYQAGCRCPSCTRANTAYQRQARAGARGDRSHRMGAYALDAEPVLVEDDPW